MLINCISYHTGQNMAGIQTTEMESHGLSEDDLINKVIHLIFDTRNILRQKCSSAAQGLRVKYQRILFKMSKD